MYSVDIYNRVRRACLTPRDTLPKAMKASHPCAATLRARRPSPVEERCHALRQGYRETAAARGLHQTRRLAEASSSLQHRRAENTPISSRGPPTGFAQHGVLKIHLIEAAKLPVSSALAISSLVSLSFKMNARVTLLQIASQQLKQCRNGGGGMPRNPRPDTIGTGGRITPEYAHGSIRSENLWGYRVSSQ